MLYIDTVSKTVAQHPKPLESEGFKILILFTGLSHDLTSSAFNSRVDACKKTAALLGIMGGVSSASILSGIPHETYLAHKKRLPEELRPRAEHYFSETARVDRGLSAWDEGDWSMFGRLMNESSLSTLENYDSGSTQSQFLFEITSKHEGVFGAAVNGGGYGGCIVAFVSEDFAEIQQMKY